MNDSCEDGCQANRPVFILKPTGFDVVPHQRASMDDSPESALRTPQLVGGTPPRNSPNKFGRPPGRPWFDTARWTWPTRPAARRNPDARRAASSHAKGSVVPPFRRVLRSGDRPATARLKGGTTTLFDVVPNQRVGRDDPCSTSAGLAQVLPVAALLSSHPRTGGNRSVPVSPAQGGTGFRLLCCPPPRAPAECRGRWRRPVRLGRRRRWGARPRTHSRAGTGWRLV